MATRKKYIAKLIQEERMRKRRLKKKLKRQKKLFGRRKEAINKAKNEKQKKNA